MSINSLQDFVLRQMTAPLRLALEARAPLEHGAMFVAQPLLSMAPKGDGHPVLVLPLMFGNDLSMLPLRSFIAGRGYAASAWEQGLNLGPRAGVFDGSLARLRELRREHGRPVSLVGWSLGGLFARALALASPDDVRCVISIATPITSDPSPEKMWRMYERFTGDSMGLPDHVTGLDQPLSVPATSIFSRSDGIVPWQGSIERSGPQSESIEVESSHLGLGVHPLTLYAIADRLAQPEGQWRPFDRSGLLSWLYRDPAREGWF